MRGEFRVNMRHEDSWNSSSGFGLASDDSPLERPWNDVHNGSGGRKAREWRLN
jgi:hypothetical protein